jgi:hypothetical protein
MVLGLGFEPSFRKSECRVLPVRRTQISSPNIYHDPLTSIYLMILDIVGNDEEILRSVGPLALIQLSLAAHPIIQDDTNKDHGLMSRDVCE